MLSPPECEPRSLGLGKVCRESPRASAWSERAVKSSLAFYATLAHPFRSEGGVEYARLPSVGASGDTFGQLLSALASLFEEEVVPPAPVVDAGDPEP